MGKKGKKKHRPQIQGQRIGSPSSPATAAISTWPQQSRKQQALLKLIERFFELLKSGGQYYRAFEAEDWELYTTLLSIPDLDQQVSSQWLPQDVVLANRQTLLRKHPDYNSYSGYPWYYRDRAFNCQDCGQAQVWSAAQQKWWYEEIGGNLYSQATRCRACRQAHRQAHRQEHKKNPEGEPPGT